MTHLRGMGQFGGGGMAGGGAPGSPAPDSMGPDPNVVPAPPKPDRGIPSMGKRKRPGGAKRPAKPAGKSAPPFKGISFPNPGSDRSAKRTSPMPPKRY